MIDDQKALDRMKADLLIAARLGLFADLMAVVFATVKLRRLEHPDRAVYDAMAERMFAEVRDALQDRLRAKHEPRQTQGAVRRV